MVIGIGGNQPVQHAPDAGGFNRGGVQLFKVNGLYNFAHFLRNTRSQGKGLGNNLKSDKPAYMRKVGMSHIKRNNV